MSTPSAKPQVPGQRERVLEALNAAAGVPAAAAADTNGKESSKESGKESGKDSSKESGKDSSGRETNGRFAKGNPGGPGNPHGRRVAAARRAFFDVAEPLFPVIVRQVCEQALRGDRISQRLVIEYLLGRPAAASDPDRVDVEERQLANESAVPLDELLKQQTDTIPAETANEIMANIGPVMTGVHMEMIADEFSGKARERRKEKRRARKERIANRTEDEWAARGAPSHAWLLANGYRIPEDHEIVTLDQLKIKDWVPPTPPTPSNPAAETPPSPSPNGHSATKPPSSNGRSAKDAKRPRQGG
jgi:hypothetical protein